MTPSSPLDRTTRISLADALEARESVLVAEVLARFETLAPELVADARLREASGEIAEANLRALVDALRTGDLTAPTVAPPATENYAYRLADLDLPADRLHSIFRGAQRVYLTHIVAAAVEALPAPLVARELPPLMEAALEYGETGMAEVSRLYAAAIEWRARRSGAGAAVHLRLVLSGEIRDESRAAALLGHPVRGGNVALVVRATDPAVLRAAVGTVRRLARGRAVLLAPRDEGTTALWAQVDGAVDPDAWAAELGELRGLSAALGEPGTGLDGFRRTHQQATAAFGVVGLSDASPRVAPYARVAPLVFLAGEPARARDWLRWTLGDLAAPGEGTERLRVTLRAYLAAGENPGAVAERMFVHRNTIGYRVGRAVRLLPRGLDGHRTEVALALDLLTWFPEAVELSSAASSP